MVAGGTNRAHWEDVTENTPLTFVNDCVSFTTTVSARYWLIDCRHVEDATKMATELYRYGRKYFDDSNYNVVHNITNMSTLNADMCYVVLH